MHDLRPMKRSLITLAATFALLISSPAHAQVGILNAQKFKTEVDAGKALLIDVRTPEEFTKGHIAGAVNIDWLDDGFAKNTSGLDKSKPVLLYCAAGGRSEEAKLALSKSGFKTVTDLEGGINAWKHNGLPVTTK